MTLSVTLLTKQVAKLMLPLLLLTSTVIATTQATLAMPLNSILDRVGRNVIKETLGVDSDAEVPPSASQTPNNTQEETDSSSETPTQTDSASETPTYTPQAYPPGYTLYPPQAYPPSYIPYPPQVYPPTYPQAYPLPVYVLPTFVPPAYPSPTSSGQSSMPLIINNINR